MGQKLTGTALDALPEGYEIHESPEHGEVVVCKRYVPSPLEASCQVTWGVFPGALKGPLELPPK